MNWSMHNKGRRGHGATTAAMPPHLDLFYIFDPLVSAPADGNFPIRPISIVIPLLLQPVVANPIFEPAKSSPAADCIDKLLTCRTGRQRLYEILHNTVFVDVIFCRKPKESFSRVFNQLLQFIIMFSGNDLVLQINRFTSLCIIKISKCIIGSLDCVNYLV